LREIGQVANQLIAAGYQRDSDAFYQALNMRVDKKNTDTDLPTPDEAVGITMARSKYSDPDGGKNVNEYNRGVHRLNYEKSLGNYKE